MRSSRPSRVLTASVASARTRTNCRPAWLLLVMSRTPTDLPAALGRLVDSGRLVRPEGRLVMRTTRGFHSSEPFSRVDELAAAIVASIRSRSDRFDSDEQLAEWLAEDCITYADAE